MCTPLYSFGLFFVVNAQDISNHAHVLIVFVVVFLYLFQLSFLLLFFKLSASLDYLLVFLRDHYVTCICTYNSHGLLLYDLFFNFSSPSLLFKDLCLNFVWKRTYFFTLELFKFWLRNPNKLNICFLLQSLALVFAGSKSLLPEIFFHLIPLLLPFINFLLFFHLNLLLFIELLFLNKLSFLILKLHLLLLIEEYLVLFPFELILALFLYSLYVVLLSWFVVFYLLKILGLLFEDTRQLLTLKINRWARQFHVINWCVSSVWLEIWHLALLWSYVIFHCVQLSENILGRSHKPYSFIIRLLRLLL